MRRIVNNRAFLSGPQKYGMALTRAILGDIVRTWAD
jgi:hypothetical protein